MRVIAASLSLFAILTLCSCEPKIISGEMFAVVSPGVNLPIGSVEVQLVKRSEVDRFMSKKKAVIAAKHQTLIENFKNAQKRYEAAIAEAASLPKEADIIAIRSTNSEHMALKQQINQAHKYLVDFRTKYMNWNHTSPAMLPATKDMKSIEETASKLQQTESALSKQFYELDRETNSYLFNQQNLYDSKKDEAKTALDRAKSAMDTYPVAEDYFVNFEPQKIDSVVTASDGSFSISARTGTMIFAVAAIQDAKVFWLVPLPESGHKLILSNQNLFKPDSSSVASSAAQ